MENFVFLNPGGKEIYVGGLNSTINIFWKGGPPQPNSNNVVLRLDDITMVKEPQGYGQIVLSIVGNITYDALGIGRCEWILPLNFAFDPSHDYVIYIEDAPRTTWLYSNPFKIV